MDIYQEQNILTLTLDQRLDYKFSSHYVEILTNSELSLFNVIELDFSQTKFISLPGAMYLVFTIYSIINLKKKKGVYVETGITGYSKKVLNVIANFGLISILKLYGNLQISPEIDQFSISMLSFGEKSVKNLRRDLQSIYWPISTIPPKFGNRYDLEIHKFHNNFIDYFKAVIDLGMIKNFNHETLEYIEKDFSKAINESTKNVWDHSESWGIASIQSNKINNTTFCLFDFGIGFINSYIKRKGNYKRSVTSDEEVLRWLFAEGNSSNSEGDISNLERNYGHGLSIIQRFVNISEGILLVSTDNYLVRYNKKGGLKIDVKSYFPGTQIMINF